MRARDVVPGETWVPVDDEPRLVTAAERDWRCAWFIHLTVDGERRIWYRHEDQLIATCPPPEWFGLSERGVA